MTALHAITRTPAGQFRTCIADVPDQEAQRELDRWERLRRAGQIDSDVIGFELSGGAGDTRLPEQQVWTAEQLALI